MAPPTVRSGDGLTSGEGRGAAGVRACAAAARDAAPPRGPELQRAPPARAAPAAWGSEAREAGAPLPVGAGWAPLSSAPAVRRAPVCPRQAAPVEGEPAEHLPVRVSRSAGEPRRVRKAPEKAALALPALRARRERGRAVLAVPGRRGGGGWTRRDAHLSEAGFPGGRAHRTRAWASSWSPAAGGEPARYSGEFCCARSLGCVRCVALRLRD